jgi:hypothetical protein
LKIYDFKKDYASNHSSVSYEFLAVDKPLTKSGIAAVSRFTDVPPTPRRARITNDFPGGWEKLMLKYYDIMYREFNKHYTFAIAFEASASAREELMKYLFVNSAGQGIDMAVSGSRAVLLFNCLLEPDYYVDDDDFNDIEIEERLNADVYDVVEEDNQSEVSSEYDDVEDVDYDDPVDDESQITQNTLLTLLLELRTQLVQGNYSSLHVFWETYADEDDPLLKWPPTPKRPDPSNLVALELSGLLDFMCWP